MTSSGDGAFVVTVRLDVWLAGSTVGGVRRGEARRGGVKLQQESPAGNYSWLGSSAMDTPGIHFHIVDNNPYTVAVSPNPNIHN